MSDEKRLSDPIWWSNYIQDERFDDNLDLVVAKDGKNICSIVGKTPNFTINRNCDEKELNHSLIVCGLIDWFFDYSTSKSPTSSIASVTSDGNLKKWFEENLNKKVLIIDTNILVNRIFSSLNYLAKNFFTNIDLRIPRLTILELERKLNDQSDLFEKRKFFSAYAELLYLKNNGARSMSELQIETLTGFSNISGNRKTDSWIRREIKDARVRALLAKIVENYVLMSADLVNSFSAVAEDIDSIYVHKIIDWKSKIRTPLIEQIGRLVTTLATAYENIDLTINTQKFQVDGIWEGKTVWDWAQENVWHRSLT